MLHWKCSSGNLEARWRLPLIVADGRGVKQYVLFGAGLNTYAYRNQIENLKVFRAFLDLVSSFPTGSGVIIDYELPDPPT
jgi:hypothetical protein